MKNLDELRDKAYQCAVTHGWHKEDMSDEHYLCLVISELMEAVEAERKERYADIDKFTKYQHSLIYETTKERAFINAYEEYIKGSVDEELADACIRLFDLAGLRNIRLYNIDERQVRLPISCPEWFFTESIYWIVCKITNVDDIDGFTLNENLRYLIELIIGLAKNRGIDIFWHIEQKMRYNELRPYKHDGKKY